MQLLAHSKEGKVVNAQRAHKQKTYRCLECGGQVRVRGGIHRQLHFYHLEPTISCRQHQKGMSHLQVQSYLLHRFGESDCSLEYRMPEINRIADVVWLSQKIVFEIQCSPISALEVRQRNADYQKLGWTVVWILHDRRFNQIRHSAAEAELRHSPHYFTNMNGEGVGLIYDQFDHLAKGRRLHRLPYLPINVVALKKIESSLARNKALPRLVQRRIQSWRLYLADDLTDLALEGEKRKDYLDKVLQLESQINSELRASKPASSFLNRLVVMYKSCLFYFLENATK
jgi:competence protein CoiA